MVATHRYLSEFPKIRSKVGSRKLAIGNGQSAMYLLPDGDVLSKGAELIWKRLAGFTTEQTLHYRQASHDAWLSKLEVPCEHF